MKHVFYFGRFWIGCYPTKGHRWFAVTRPGRGVYVSIGPLVIGWA